MTFFIARDVGGETAASARGIGGERAFPSFSRDFPLGTSATIQTTRGALIAFPDEDGSLRHKIYGGTIVPKRAQALTIPLIPEAHGRRAHDFAREFGKLFTLRQSLLNIRNQNTGSNHRTGYLFQALESGGIRAVYALRKSVTHQPWPNAIPSDEALAEEYANSLQESLIGILEGEI